MLKLKLTKNMRNKNQVQKHNQKAGFTLIELLVVVAIIGLLSSIVLISLNTARSRARDAKRITDVTQVGKALESYYNDNAGYPAALADLATGATVYMAVVPTAPTPPDNPIGASDCDATTNAYTYTQTGSGTGYTLTFCLGGQTGSYGPGTHTMSQTGIQ
jgi:prepilin-type N-terminal cleavage/methylation domain-containing protein